jgi:hypothetical protein
MGDETFKVSLKPVIVCSERVMKLLALLGRQVGLCILQVCIIAAASSLPLFALKCNIKCCSIPMET